VLSDVRQDEIRRDWRDLVEARLAKLALDVVPAAKPKPPCVCRQTFAASHDAFAARYFAMFASAPHGSCRSNNVQAFHRIKSGASISM
jgi:hypothetical protein